MGSPKLESPKTGSSPRTLEAGTPTEISANSTMTTIVSQVEQQQQQQEQQLGEQKMQQQQEQQQQHSDQLSQEQVQKQHQMHQEEVKQQQVQQQQHQQQQHQHSSPDSEKGEPSKLKKPDQDDSSPIGSDGSSKGFIGFEPEGKLREIQIIKIFKVLYTFKMVADIHRLTEAICDIISN